MKKKLETFIQTIRIYSQEIWIEVKNVPKKEKEKQQKE